MPNKLFLSLVLAVLFLSVFKQVSADIVINEIMYAPEGGGGYEWIEIFNSGNDAVDLTDWRFFNNKIDSAPLRLQKGSVNLSPNGYAIVTTISGVDYFSGTVFSSSKFSLPNDSFKYNTYKAISDSNKQIIDFVTYTTNANTTGTGNSLQLIDGSWSGATPTPGSANQSTSSSSDDEDDTYDSDKEETEEVKEKSEKVITTNKKPKAEIKGEEIALVGIPFKLEGVAFGNDGQQEYSGRYFWNFGDGDSREVKTKNSDKFTHTYFYSGEYDILFEYYPNYFTDVPDSSDKLTVKVIDPKVYISKMGDANDFFVELTNNTNFNVNISGWKIIGSLSVFTFPKNSNLSSRKSMTLSPQLTGLSVLDKNSLTLADSEGKVIHKYITSARPVYSEKTYTGNKEINKVPAKETTSLRNNLVASALFGEDEEDKEEIVVPVWFSILSFVFLIGAGVSGAYVIRKRGIIKKKVAGEDFEILDE
jgi:hypothetical protein